MTKWDKNIELRSEEVKEIIGKTPSWLVRWGTLSLAVVLILLLLISVWFRYPDRIRSELTLLSGQPPMQVTARTDGRIKSILVEDKQFVHSGMILAVIESADEYSAVEHLKLIADSLNQWIMNADMLSVQNFLSSDRLVLGSLKNELADLELQLRNYLNYLRIGKYERKVKALKKEIYNSNMHFQRLFGQKQIKGEELELAEKGFERQKELFQSGAISEVQFESEKQNLNKYRYEFGETWTALSAQSIDISRLNKTLDDYKISQQEEEETVKSLIDQAIVHVQGAVREWELKYLLRSSIDGYVSFTRFYSQNQVVKSGDHVMTVLQDSDSILTGRLLLPIKGAGKVKEGQKVLVRFNEFPHMEFGVVTGEVESISLVSDQDHYSVGVRFPKGLRTSYDVSLHPTQGMTGQAEIITQNISFLVRIVNPIRALLSENRILN